MPDKASAQLGTPIRTTGVIEFFPKPGNPGFGWKVSPEIEEEMRKLEENARLPPDDFMMR